MDPSPFLPERKTAPNLRPRSRWGTTACALLAEASVGCIRSRYDAGERIPGSTAALAHGEKNPCTDTFEQIRLVSDSLHLGSKVWRTDGDGKEPLLKVVG